MRKPPPPRGLVDARGRPKNPIEWREGEGGLNTKNHYHHHIARGWLAWWRGRRGTHLFSFLCFYPHTHNCPIPSPPFLAGLKGRTQTHAHTRRVAQPSDDAHFFLPLCPLFANTLCLPFSATPSRVRCVWRLLFPCLRGGGGAFVVWTFFFSLGPVSSRQTPPPPPPPPPRRAAREHTQTQRPFLLSFLFGFTVGVTRAQHTRLPAPLLRGGAAGAAGGNTRAGERFWFFTWFVFRTARTFFLCRPPLLQPKNKNNSTDILARKQHVETAGGWTAGGERGGWARARGRKPSPLSHSLLRFSRSQVSQTAPAHAPKQAAATACSVPIWGRGVRVGVGERDGGQRAAPQNGAPLSPTQPPRQNPRHEPRRSAHNCYVGTTASRRGAGRNRRPP